jgi:hypothetical protein
MKGPYDPNRQPIPIIFRNDLRWFDQAVAHSRGGLHDYDVSARKRNIERMKAASHEV